MNKNTNIDNIVKEEQEILDNLIGRMDAEMLLLDEKLTSLTLERRKATEECLPETYGTLVDNNNEIRNLKGKKEQMQLSKDELYDHRIVVKVVDDDGECDVEDLKIGLHTFSSKSEIFVCSWTRPVCRHYLLNDIDSNFVNETTDKYGRTYKSVYTLNMKRKVDLRFTKVMNALQMYPIMTEEEQKIIADEFLQELASRRNEQEFRNIVFSIQKQQGKIIQSPFKQNMIVQGCAGSGKSMIMLHRLPIILYDNPSTLNRANLYIITPSLVYIQMAENMRYQLEISDLNMGTLEQYYDYVIGKYGRSPEEYGRLNLTHLLSEENETYVYSAALIKDINNELDRQIETVKFDYQIGVRGLSVKSRDRICKTRVELLNQKIIQAQEIINTNSVQLKKYFIVIKGTIKEIIKLKRMCESRKAAIIVSIDNEIDSNNKQYLKAKDEIEKLDREKNPSAIKNREDTMRMSKTSIQKLKILKSKLDEDTEYFSRLEKIQEEIDKVLKLFIGANKEYEKLKTYEIYDLIDKKNILVTVCNDIGNVFKEYKENYIKVVTSLKKQSNLVVTKGRQLSMIYEKILNKDYCASLLANVDNMTLLSDSIVRNTYLECMRKIGINASKRGKVNAIKCSPYIFLQVLYAYQGCPNAQKENLITIDEAQGLSPLEIELIKNVNDNKVILNLFGDEKQHIEGTKGIDSWSELSDILKFKQYNMLENYRNARQITEYCNKRFNMNMRSINLDGQGVHEFMNYEEFKEGIIKQFMSAHKQGLSVIIVKSIDEAKMLFNVFHEYENKMHNLTEDDTDIHRTRWNVITVEEAKGLEFGNVIALTGRMTQNEKYIAYTRALDELWVYDKVIDIPKRFNKQIQKEKNEDINKHGDIPEKLRERKVKHDEAVDYTNSKVRNFFETAGIKVNDQREEGGKLWIIGEKEKISRFVDDATDKFGISGVYGADKGLGIKEGWSTKTKK